MNQGVGPGIADIEAAATRLAGTVRRTPVWPAVLDSKSPGPLLIKCEQLQLTGSFKLRGALNFVRRLPPEELARGLVTASAGNHAQGVAFAGRAAGAAVAVVMPENAPLAKIEASSRLGAEVILHGESLAEARERAGELVAEQGWILVPPFDNDDVIAGQGTVGLEIVEQVPDVDTVLVPAGGGGLLAGVAVAVKSRRPAARVIGVQTRVMDGIRQSLIAGRPVSVPAERTMADGVAVAGPSERTFSLISRHVDDVVAVGEESIAQAVVFLIERAKLVSEGAGALPIAALQSGACSPKGTTVAVLSGGNIDMNLIGAVVRHGLAEAGRHRRLTVEVADVPGELALLADGVARRGGNVLEVEHVREAVHLPVGVAILNLVVEVKGEAHFAEIVSDLRRLGVRGRTNGRLTTSAARKRMAQG